MLRPMKTNHWAATWMNLAVLAVVTACSADKDTAEPAPELDFSEFDEAIEQYLLDNSLEGATAVVVHRDWGVMHQSGYGAFDVDRVSLIASSSKTISVSVIMSLDDDGLLDIDAPVSDALSDWTSDKPNITVAQMLSNSSGMIGLLNNPLYVPYVCQYLEAGTLADCARTIYEADDSADLIAPDTAFRYGGGQWQLAGGVAEAVSGKTWGELFSERIAEPCGLDTSGYTNQFQTAQLAYPTYFDGDINDLPVSNNPNVEGGMYTSTSDYGKLLLMQLRGGMCDDTRVLSESAIETMQADRIGDVYDGDTGNADLPGYGLGWWVSRDNPGFVQDGGAYGSQPWIDRERGYAAFIVVESTSPVGSALAAQTRPLLESLFDAAAL